MIDDRDREVEAWLESAYPPATRHGDWPDVRRRAGRESRPSRRVSNRWGSLTPLLEGPRRRRSHPTLPRARSLAGLAVLALAGLGLLAVISARAPEHARVGAGTTVSLPAFSSALGTDERASTHLRSTLWTALITSPKCPGRATVDEQRWLAAGGSGTQTGTSTLLLSASAARGCRTRSDLRAFADRRWAHDPRVSTGISAYRPPVLRYDDARRLSSDPSVVDREIARLARPGSYLPGGDPRRYLEVVGRVALDWPLSPSVRRALLTAATRRHGVRTLGTQTRYGQKVLVYTADDVDSAIRWEWWFDANTLITAGWRASTLRATRPAQTIMTTRVLRVGIDSNRAARR